MNSCPYSGYKYEYNKPWFVRITDYVFERIVRLIAAEVLAVALFELKYGSMLTPPVPMPWHVWRCYKLLGRDWDEEERAIDRCWAW